MNSTDLRSALERVTDNYRRTLAGKPVRDVAETLAEADAALAQPTAPVAWWIPKAEQFALAKPDGSRPFAKAWEPLYAAAPALLPAPADERAAFENWARSEWGDRAIPDNAWLGWQARAALGATCPASHGDSDA